MHQRKGKKILIYFFLLLIVGSINNIKLNNLKFTEINIEITGIEESEKKIILENINNLNLSNYFFINRIEILKIINSISLVEKFSIFKKYPDTLKIKIQQTKFLAKINYKGKEYFVGENGKLIKSTFSNKNLPYIFGKPDINEFLLFKKIIDQSKLSYKEIKNFYFFPSKRWDIELRNNTLIKLSKNTNIDSINTVFKFLGDKNFDNLNIVDARINNQIILND